jgi:hypothetical protein
MIFNKIEPLEVTAQKIEAVTSGQLLDIANDILDARNLSYLIYH